MAITDKWHKSYPVMIVTKLKFVIFFIELEIMISYCLQKLSNFKSVLVAYTVVYL